MRWTIIYDRVIILVEWFQADMYVANELKTNFLTLSMEHRSQMNRHLIVSPGLHEQPLMHHANRLTDAT